MFVGPVKNLLTLTNTRAKALAGRSVIIGGSTYQFKSFDPNQPGQPPWRTGAEGKAYPLLGNDEAIAAYLKFFTHPSEKRLQRTAWLIGQRMHTWLPHLAAAPLLWTDTRHSHFSGQDDFYFAAYLAKAVPGETWLELKSGIAGGGVRFTDGLRWRCVEDLLLSLAVLEQAELIHGDLSPNNVVIDLAAIPGAPTLYLIDFDAFVAPAAGENRAVTLAEGGTYGTDGYCPPGLAAAASEGNGNAAPFSDRYGRDMLLLEFLLMGCGFPADAPLDRWNREQLGQHFAAWRARNDPKFARAMCHLDPANVFRLDESQRAASTELALGLDLSLPQRRVLRRVVELSRPTPAILGPSAAQPRRISRVSAATPKPMDVVMESLATGRSERHLNATADEPMVFGCVMAAGVAIILIALLIAAFGFATSGNDSNSSGVSDPVSSLACLVACFVFCVLPFLALGYFIVNRK